LSTQETVGTETPASSAIVAIVARGSRGTSVTRQMLPETLPKLPCARPQA
jgi:hypothetical protein